MGKLMKCKTCGAEITKSEKACPLCGAKQHKGVYVACAVVAAIAVIGCVAVVAGSMGGRTSSTQNTQGDHTAKTLTFSGDGFEAEYKGCSSSDLVDGCFYVSLSVNNTGDVEQMYVLDDVYVENSHCSTGTGLPVTALPGKGVTGSFIVSCETPLEDVEKVEFRLSVLNSETLDQLTESEVITVYPNG